jgi:hypothetical protein
LALLIVPHRCQRLAQLAWPVPVPVPACFSDVPCLAAFMISTVAVSQHLLMMACKGSWLTTACTCALAPAWLSLLIGPGGHQQLMR